jgi:transposase
MGRKNKLYGPLFKEEACKLVTGRGYSAAEAARQLGIPTTTLLSWLKAKERREQPLPASPGPDEPTLLRTRICELEDKLAKSEMEKDILKKAAAYFAREQP